MNNITWKYIKPLADSKVINQFLNKYNISLPEELIKCLKEHNGGRPSNPVFNTEETKECVFKALLSYNEGDYETIYMVYPHLFKNKPLYPIGVDAAGNFICYHCANREYVLWKHEDNLVEKIVF